MRLRHSPRQPQSDAADALRELLERQRVELEGQVARAERRLGELEARTAQAEQRAESAEQRAALAERKLEQTEKRAAHAERELSGSKLKPRAARRLAEARRAAEEARAEGEDLGRERALLKGRVAELEAEIDELQGTLEGERSDREAREADLQQRLAEAGAEHGREHTMRLELEQRLAADLAARQRVERELDALEQSYTATAMAGEQELSELQRARAADHGDRTPDGQIPQAKPARRSETRGRRLPFAPGWRRRSSLPCAVCRVPRPTMSDAEATASGWELAGAGALCPTCRREGWQFPPGATVPFRAAGPLSSA